MTITQTQATTTAIPLNKLIASVDNVRKTGGGIGIDELAASISAHGVLQNLIVRPPGDDAKGRYEVIAGRRRLAALHMLARNKKIAKTFPVPCVVRGPEEATEALPRTRSAWPCTRPMNSLLITPSASKGTSLRRSRCGLGFPPGMWRSG